MRESDMIEFTEVPGEDRGDVKLYAISTCVWCKRTKKLLGDLGVKFKYVFVDKLDKDARKEVENEMMKWNPRTSFPTIVIDSKGSIIGYQEDEIKEALGND